jgi:hypothetical protein
MLQTLRGQLQGTFSRSQARQVAQLRSLYNTLEKRHTDLLNKFKR